MARALTSRALRMGVPWAVAVAATWLVSTVALAAVVRDSLPGQPAAVVAHSAVVCLAGCVAIGGPATAAALAVRTRWRALTAVACGCAVAVLAFAIVASALGPRMAALTAAAPVALILAVEFVLAFRLLARTSGRRERQQAA